DHAVVVSEIAGLAGSDVTVAAPVAPTCRRARGAFIAVDAATEVTFLVAVQDAVAAGRQGASVGATVVVDAVPVVALLAVLQLAAAARFEGPGRAAALAAVAGLARADVTVTAGVVRAGRGAVLAVLAVLAAEIALLIVLDEAVSA